MLTEGGQPSWQTKVGAANGPTSASPPTSPRVLVVDRTQAGLDIAEKRLTKLGFTVEKLRFSERGLDEWNLPIEVINVPRIIQHATRDKSPFDAVITCYDNGENRYGIDVVKNLKALGFKGRCFAIGNDLKPYEIENMRNAGADGIFEKGDWYKIAAFFTEEIQAAQEAAQIKQHTAEVAAQTVAKAAKRVTHADFMRKRLRGEVTGIG